MNLVKFRLGHSVRSRIFYQLIITYREVLSIFYFCDFMVIVKVPLLRFKIVNKNLLDTYER